MFSIDIKSIFSWSFPQNQEVSCEAKENSKQRFSSTPEWKYWPAHLKKDIGVADVSIAPDGRSRFNVMF